MATVLFILLAVCCVVPVLCEFEGLPMEEEEIRAIQERLARLEGLEKYIKYLAAPDEEAREENCIREGVGCSFGSGPNCCGLRTRCIIWDHYTPQRGGPAKWHSVCREYKAGVALDEIGKFFARLG